MTSPKLAVVVASIATASLLGSCASDAEQVEDPIEGQPTSTIASNLSPADRGVEGGLNLDSGNVPGSERDDLVDQAENSDGVTYDE